MANEDLEGAALGGCCGCIAAPFVIMFFTVCLAASLYISSLLKGIAAL